MINVMTSPGHGGSPRSARRVAGRPRDGRLAVRSPSRRERFSRSLAKAFYWPGWKTVGAVATSLVAISTAIVAIATFVVASRTLQANTRQQTSDRFVKAIEQLGNEKSPDVRLGGIYGLEQLARDSPSDQPAVFDVLTAFVRGQVPAGTGKCTDPTLHLGFIDESPNASPSPDVLAAVDAIGRRDRNNDRKDQVLDLSNTCLVAVKCDRLQLSGISMAGADLRSADFYQANLHQTNLDGANLTRADLAEANLTGADLRRANLTRANLAEANLTGANLAVADLTGANLAGADLTEANLVGADLTQANLGSANLTRADLGSADLTEAYLGSANLSDIKYDRTTRWPNGFRPPPSR